MKKLLISAVALTFLLSACGGGGGSQDEVADLLLEVAGEEGLELNEECVRNITDQLSDDDAQAIVDAGVDGDPQLSAEGDALGDDVFTDCVDASSYIDLIVDSFTEDDDTIDADCLRGEFEGLTVDEVDEKLFSAAFACTTE